MEEDQKKITPEFVIDLIKRRRWFILLPLFVALIGGIYYAKTTPKIYQAKTLILVEGQRVPQDYVQSIVTEETGERINTISQQILSRTNLEKITKEYALFQGPEYEKMYMEDKVDSLRKAINVNVITDRQRQTDAFEITFKGKDPEKVTNVLNGLAYSFIEENLKVREDQALGTSSFLETELGSMRSNLERLEEKIKIYRKTNMGELPEQLETNLRILERLQENLSDSHQALREGKIRLSELKHQAMAKQPSVVVIGGSQRSRDGAGASLSELIARLETLQSRYTEKHPDIIRLKKQIAEMKNRKASSDDGEISLYDRISPELRRQVSDAQRDIQVAQSEITNLEGQIASYQKRIETTPKREQELLSLKRDYMNIQSSYESLLKRKLEADIAVNMERKQKGEQFRIVDPAKKPQKPVEPDMRKVFLMVVFAGLGIGGGLVFVLEYMDSTFRKPEELEKELDIAVLVTMPKIESPKQLMYRKLNAVGSIAFAAMNICILGVFGLMSLAGG